MARPTSRSTCGCCSSRDMWTAARRARPVGTASPTRKSSKCASSSAAGSRRTSIASGSFSAVGSSPQLRRGSHPKRCARPRIRSSGQNPVRLDWKRLKPTNTVKMNHAGFTQTPSATDAITKSPAIRRISASLHI